MTRVELKVLEEVLFFSKASFLPKSYFDSFPRKRRIAKDLMWRGYLESVGPFGDRINITPAGITAMEAE